MIFNRYKIFGHYFCDNCGSWFRTGCRTRIGRAKKYCRDLFDGFCPYCGAVSAGWWTWFGFYWCRLKECLRKGKGK